MAKHELVSLIGSSIFRKSPNGSLTQIEITNYKVAEYLLSLQEYGYTLIRPVQRLGGECEACSA